MKIIRLFVNNILNLRAIEVRPDPNINKISGRNGAGKTNLLETIRFTLLGKRSMPEKPLREGAKKGDIKIDIGDYIVEVKITKNGEYWNVTDKEGKPVSKPMDLLKKIVGPISFDPLAMLDDDPKKLRAVLLELVGVDLDEFDTKIKALRDERTIAGRTLKQTKALLEACPYHDDAPEQEVSVSDITAELQKANDNNNEIQRAGRDIDEARVIITKLEAGIKIRIEYLQEHTIIDTAAITEKLNKADETNRQIRDNAEYMLRTKAVSAEQDAYDSLSDNITDLAQEKDELLQNATMPIDGLSVDEDGVIYNGIPIAQVNKAKRIEIGCAIHMKQNPKLKVMFIEGDHFDSDTEAAIEEAVKGADYQLFSEVVDDTSETGIHLVDGTLKEN